MHVFLRIAIPLMIAPVAACSAAEDTTSTFLNRCQETASCEKAIYIILDGDPMLNTKYACLLEADGQPLLRRIVNWLQANKAQSSESLLQDIYSALDALRVENLDGTC